MENQTSKIRGLKVGDLVTHVLYGNEWIGVIIQIVKNEASASMSREKALVQIQPGTKYDRFFSNVFHKSHKVSDNLGYVSINWLFKIEEKII